MKKWIALLLCLVTILSLSSCVINIHAPDKNDDVVNDPNADPQVSENDRIREAYGAVLRNESTLYYPLLDSPTPYESYFRDIRGAKDAPLSQALIDMDGNGTEELILSFDRFLILLWYENNAVYATDFEHEAMETVYTDGSFFWRNNSSPFGNEQGISRISFANGQKKFQELCRKEGESLFYVDGVRVTKEQYENYLEKNERTPVEFTLCDTSFFNPEVTKALALASAHWGIRDGDFEEETGYRYRIVCTDRVGEIYKISLYRFINNSYYLHMETADVNVETEEITICPYPDGKG